MDFKTAEQILKKLLDKREASSPSVDEDLVLLPPSAFLRKWIETSFVTFKETNEEEIKIKERKNAFKKFATEVVLPNTQEMTKLCQTISFLETKHPSSPKKNRVKYNWEALAFLKRLETTRQPKWAEKESYVKLKLYSKPDSGFRQSVVCSAEMQLRTLFEKVRCHKKNVKEVHVLPNSTLHRFVQNHLANKEHDETFSADMSEELATLNQEMSRVLVKEPMYYLVRQTAELLDPKTTLEAVCRHLQENKNFVLLVHSVFCVHVVEVKKLFYSSQKLENGKQFVERKCEGGFYPKCFVCLSSSATILICCHSKLPRKNVYICGKKECKVELYNKIK